MTNLIPFAFEDHVVRVFEREDGSIWFVAADVCRALGLSNTSKAVAALDEDEKGITSTYTLGGEQGVLAISEGGLYTLVLRSRQATTPGTVPHRFRKFVTGEVLPQIRRTGRYAAPVAAERREEEDWSADEARINLAKVAEYRKIYGSKSARWKAQELGFSKPPAHTRRTYVQYDPDLGREVMVREDEEDEL